MDPSHRTITRTRSRRLTAAAALFTLAVLGCVALGAAGAAAFPNHEPIYSYTVTPPVAGAIDTFNDTSASRLGALYVTGEIGRDTADLCLTRVGAHGWTRYYDGPAHGADEGRLVAAIDAGGAYVAGISPSRGGVRQLVVARYSANGHRLWVHRHPATEDDTVAEIAVDGGGVSVAGTTGDRALLVRYSAAGRSSWARTWGAVGKVARVYDLKATPDGSLYVCGALEAASGNSAAAMLARFRTGGSRVWVKKFTSGGPTAYNSFYAVCRRPAGGVVAVGLSAAEGLMDGCTLATRYSSRGALQRAVITPAEAVTALDVYEDVAIDRNGRVDVCGKVLTGGLQRFTVRQLDDAFAERWTYQTDFGLDNGVAYELNVDPRGRILALGPIPAPVGPTPHDVAVLVSLRATGAERWMYGSPGSPDYDHYLWSVTRSRSTNAYACGMYPNASGGFDAVLFGWSL